MTSLAAEKDKKKKVVKSSDSSHRLPSSKVVHSAASPAPRSARSVTPLPVPSVFASPTSSAKASSSKLASLPVQEDDMEESIPSGSTNNESSSIMVSPEIAKMMLLAGKIDRETYEAAYGTTAANEGPENLSANPWDHIAPGQIYSVFFRKGAQLGTVANRILTELCRQGFLSSSSSSNGKVILAKKKDEIFAQRRQIENLPPRGLKVLREYLFSNHINPDGTSSSSKQTARTRTKRHSRRRHSTASESDGTSSDGDDDGDAVVYCLPEETVNLQARVAHMAVEGEESEAILVNIFSSQSLLTKAARRSILDDKSVRNKELWLRLADDFINNSAWNPVNEFEDSRLDYVDPRFPPTKPITAEQLRKMWSDLRTKYSLVNENFNRSGNGLQGDGDGDDDFYENFCQGNLVFFYMHKLFGGKPPSYVTRDLREGLQSDVGAGFSDDDHAAAQRKPTQGKRTYIGTHKHPSSGAGVTVEASAEEKERDKAMASYYRTLAAQAKCNTMTSTLESASFKDKLDESDQEKCTEAYRNHILANVFEV